VFLITVNSPSLFVERIYLNNKADVPTLALCLTFQSKNPDFLYH